MTSFDRDAVLVRLRAAWCEGTSSRYTPETPARGQCGVTALVVQAFHGGDIVWTPVDRRAHFYNFVDGERADLTAEQFDTVPDYRDSPTTRAAALSDTTPEQYATLARRYRRRLD